MRSKTYFQNKKVKSNLDQQQVCRTRPFSFIAVNNQDKCNRRSEKQMNKAGKNHNIRSEKFYNAFKIYSILSDSLKTSR